MPNGYIDKARRADPRDRERRKVCDPPPRHSLPFLPPSLHPLSLASILCLLSHYLGLFPFGFTRRTREPHLRLFSRVTRAKEEDRRGRLSERKKRRKEKKKRVSTTGINGIHPRGLRSACYPRRVTLAAPRRPTQSPRRVTEIVSHANTERVRYRSKIPVTTLRRD